MSRPWSRREVEAVVSDYFAMWAREMRGEPYSKAAHWRALIPRLEGRNRGSIEYKHGNISAVLRELRHPWIVGYRPFGNYQRLLADVVIERLMSDADLASAVQAAINGPVTRPAVGDILGRETPPPTIESPRYAGVRESEFIVPPVGIVDRLGQEARNAALGLAGEEFVIDFERARLRSLGREKLAESVVHVSATEGDGAGFDILSFERDGSDRYIEVKTTAFASQTPFYLSVNELRVSREREERYQLYRVYGFRRDPRLFMLSGALDTTCRLDAVQFRARVA